MVHNRIALFRVDRGWSRKELAERVDVNPQTIGFLERGAYSPSVELALKIAREFGARVEDLFSLTDFPSLASALGPRPVAEPAEPPETSP